MASSYVTAIDDVTHTSYCIINVTSNCQRNFDVTETYNHDVILIKNNGSQSKVVIEVTSYSFNGRFNVKCLCHSYVNLCNRLTEDLTKTFSLRKWGGGGGFFGGVFGLLP